MGIFVFIMTGERVSFARTPRREINTAFERHGWWLTSRRDDTSTLIVPVLHVTTDEIVGVAQYSGLGSSFGDVERVVTLRRESRGYFTITSLGLDGSSVSTFRLHKDRMMQPVPEDLLGRRPPFSGILGMGAWWREYDVTERERRQAVSRFANALDDAGRSQLRTIIASDRLASVPIASSSAGPSRVLPNPPLEDYRAFAFLIDRPPGRASRPHTVSHRKTGLPSDRYGRRAREFRASSSSRPPLVDLEDSVLPRIEEPTSSDVEDDEDDHRGGRASSRFRTVHMPTHAELEDGFVWGRSYRFIVHLEHVRPVSHALTDQCVLNLANAHEVSRRLIGPNGADVSALTLRPVAYVEEGTDSEISLVGPGGRTRFEALLPRTPLDTFGSRVTTMVVYDDERFYVEESSRVNDIHNKRARHTIVAKNLWKIRDLWVHYGCPAAHGGEDAERRAGFLSCLPSVTHIPIPRRDGQLTVSTLAKRFADWTSHVCTGMMTCGEPLRRFVWNMIEETLISPQMMQRNELLIGKGWRGMSLWGQNPLVGQCLCHG